MYFYTNLWVRECEYVSIFLYIYIYNVNNINVFRETTVFIDEFHALGATKHATAWQLRLILSILSAKRHRVGHQIRLFNRYCYIHKYTYIYRFLFLFFLTKIYQLSRENRKHISSDTSVARPSLRHTTRYLYTLFMHILFNIILLLNTSNRPPYILL